MYEVPTVLVGLLGRPPRAPTPWLVQPAGLTLDRNGFRTEPIKTRVLPDKSRWESHEKTGFVVTVAKSPMIGGGGGRREGEGWEGKYGSEERPRQDCAVESARKKSGVEVDTKW